MSKGARQKEKLLRILSFLEENTDEESGVTVKELIDYLDSYEISAERKSVYDDFLTLGDLGYPVKKLGRRPEQYTLEGRTFSLAECKLLVDAIQSSKFIPEAQSRELIGKIEHFVGGKHRSELSRTVHVENRAKALTDSVYETVDTIHSAIQKKCRILFRYFSYNSKKEKVLRRGGARYEISPYALIWREENYYLVGFDEEAGAVKHFRVDKMQSVRLYDAPRAGEEFFRRFDPAVYSSRTFGMYGGEETLVCLECADHLAGIIIDRFGTEPTFFPGDGTFRVHLRVMVSPTFYAWVMGFADEMKIISPVPVREELVRLLKRAEKIYEDGEKE